MAEKINSQIKVLFLSAWYPNRYDAMAGLFVRKHAEAASRFCNVCVLYLHPDPNIKQFEIVEQNFEKVREIYVYYPFIHNKLAAKISKTANYLRAFFKGYKVVVKSFGKPNVTQVNVLTRSAVLAYFLKQKEKIPYVIIEHFTRYLPQSFSYNGFLRKKITEIAAKNAARIMPVSADLQKAMLKNGIKGNYDVVCNVVDDFFFEKREKIKKNSAKKRILHVSCFLDKQKNITGLLRAAKELSFQRTDFELILVGTGIDFNEIYNYSKSLNFPENMLVFTGEQTPKQVAEWLATSDMLVMFSNYENAPVVISESLAMGIPVISSNTGGINEMINEKNGILISTQNEQKLTESINFMLDNFEKYNSENIGNEAQKYSYQSVGEKLFKIYSSL
jgi:glycosyltransferase involved in cell wall biosynthesis